jgi:hypothetical protein
LVFGSCAPRKIALPGDSPGYHNHIKLKFSIRDGENKDSGKIILKFDRDKSKVLFLSPFNQIYLKLYIEKSEALLINTKKKKFWQGDFRTLIDEMWNIDLEFEELKMLIMQGTVPKREIKNSSMAFILEDDKKSGKPKSIKIQKDTILLHIKVQNRKTRKGKIEFYIDFTRLIKTELRNVLLNE